MRLFAYVASGLIVISAPDHVVALQLPAGSAPRSVFEIALAPCILLQLGQLVAVDQIPPRLVSDIRQNQITLRGDCSAFDLPLGEA